MKQTNLDMTVFSSHNTVLECCVVKCKYTTKRIYDLLKHLKNNDKNHLKFI